MSCVSNSDISSYSSEDNSSMCNGMKRRVPSKSVRLRKKEQHKAHLNVKVKKGLNERLDEKRLIDEDDLAAVLGECMVIRSVTRDHTDECSYFMNCCGEPCRCDVGSKPVVVEPPVLIDVDIAPVGRMQAGYDSYVAIHNSVPGDERLPVHVEAVNEEIEKLCDVAEVCLYMKTIFARNAVGDVTCDEVACAREISRRFQYVPQPIQEFLGSFGLYSKGNCIYVPHFDVTFQDRKIQREEEPSPHEDDGVHITTYSWRMKRYDLTVLSDWYMRYCSWWCDVRPDCFVELNLSAYAQYRERGCLGIMKERPRT